jgi:hypothetical protein
MHTPKKTKKDGIKVMILADSKTHYCYNAYMDCGKNSEGKGFDKRPVAIRETHLSRINTGETLLRLS